MNEFPEKPSKEFLEYCKGKLFVIDGCHRFNPKDRWVVIGEDVKKVINYCSTVNPNSDINYSYSVYKPCPMDIDVALELSNNLPYKDLQLFLDKVEIVNYNFRVDHNVLQCILNYIKDVIGEER